MEGRSPGETGPRGGQTGREPRRGRGDEAVDQHAASLTAPCPAASWPVRARAGSRDGSERRRRGGPRIEVSQRDADYPEASVELGIDLRCALAGLGRLCDMRRMADVEDELRLPRPVSLQPGETLLQVVNPWPILCLPRYVLTLGLYEIWR